MTDITHDEVDDGFHEIHLSGKQLFALFMATVVVSVVIFLIGVFVGRNVRTQQRPPPSVSTIRQQRSRRHRSVSRRRLLRRRSRPLEAAEPPTPPAETDELSYKRRLEGPSSSESLKTPAAAPPAARPAPPQAPQTRAAAPARAPRRRRPRQGLSARRSRAPGSSRFTSFAIAQPPTASSAACRQGLSGIPRGRRTSDGTYKVQVGRYKDRDEAQKVIERLKKEEQFNPWITR